MVKMVKNWQRAGKHVKLKTDTTDVLLLHLYIKSKSEFTSSGNMNMSEKSDKNKIKI